MPGAKRLPIPDNGSIPVRSTYQSDRIGGPATGFHRIGQASSPARATPVFIGLGQADHEELDLLDGDPSRVEELYTELAAGVELHRVQDPQRPSRERGEVNVVSAMRLAEKARYLKVFEAEEALVKGEGSLERVERLRFSARCFEREVNDRVRGMRPGRFPSAAAGQGVTTEAHDRAAEAGDVALLMQNQPINGALARAVGQQELRPDGAPGVVVDTCRGDESAPTVEAGHEVVMSRGEAYAGSDPMRDLALSGADGPGGSLEFVTEPRASQRWNDPSLGDSDQVPAGTTELVTIASRTRRMASFDHEVGGAYHEALLDRVGPSSAVERDRSREQDGQERLQARQERVSSIEARVSELVQERGGVPPRPEGQSAQRGPTAREQLLSKMAEDAAPQAGAGGPEYGD